LIYLALVAVLLLLALASKTAWPLALVLIANMAATVALQEIVAYQPMMYADAITFNAMVVVCFWRRKWWAMSATALMGLSSWVHFAYYGLGDNRYDFRYWHMYALQAFYLAAVVVILFGGYDVRQFVASILDRLRGSDRNATGLVWADRRADRSA